MKIAFITSRLDIGQDGVGDYTRALAKECIRQGHECFLISLCERVNCQTGQREQTSDSQDESVKIAELRLSAQLPWDERQAQVRISLNSFKPDWVSLQFVPYGFQEKGIILGLSTILSPLVKKRRFHIMFHELWIGDYNGASIKEKLIGSLQKHFILKLHKNLDPNLIHTSNPAYMTRLANNGIISSRLRMFGAVPIEAQQDPEWVFSQVRQGGIDLNSRNRQSYTLLGIFGSLHLVWPPEPLFTYLQRASVLSGRRFVLLAIGRLGVGEQLWDKLSQSYATQFGFVKFGELPSKRISQVFREMDGGIATSPYSIIGKSSTVAAMLEHGLPVIVNRIDEEYHATESMNAAMLDQEPLLHLIDESLPVRISRVLPHSPPRLRLPDVAMQFLRDLDDAT